MQSAIQYIIACDTCASVGRTCAQRTSVENRILNFENIRHWPQLTVGT